MRKGNYLLLGFFIVFAGVLNIYAQSNNGITGFVFNTSRQPVADVYIELQNEFGSTLTRVRTSGSGFYSFRRIPEGRYRVRVLTYGTSYQEQTKSVALIPVSAVPGSGGINEQVDFSLNLNRAYIGPLAAPGVIFAQDVPKQAEIFYQDGVELLSDGKEQEGFDKLKRSLEVFPEYYLALDRLGQEYVIKGYHRPAYVLLSNALKINPKSYSSSFGLGVVQFRLGQTSESLKSLEQAVGFYGDSIDAHLWLGIVLSTKGNLKEAEESLIKANKLSNNKSADVHWQLAKIYTKTKRYGEAADELELYLKYNKKAPNADEITQSITTLRRKATKNN